ncbi:MAG: class I SAM-dependent methyltransferase [Bacteroidia bacterium]|nr:class I SAM-dependent methyltransferase [Bacteroidia bacterium]HQU99888.1 class I SAM-dependent methyltransferase [Bacteroidia bacterium]
MEKIVDKAGADYWTQVWQNTSLPLPLNTSETLSNTITLRFQEVFRKFFDTVTTNDKLLLEVGCGNSVWLPYLAKQYGFKIYGLDYSNYGCETERAILKRDFVEGEIIIGDMFNPPVNLLNKFDFVISMGVIEHFSDTTQVVKSLSSFLKPDGVLITTLPNHAGILGWLQKVFNKPVYDIHFILDKTDIENSVANADLKMIQSLYAVSGGFMVNLEAKDKPLPNIFVRKIGAKVLVVLTYLWWSINKYIVKLPENKFLSPAIINIAKK